MGTDSEINRRDLILKTAGAGAVGALAGGSSDGGRSWARVATVK
jgi:hypothetical protein